jgi:hypothetical protein
MDTGNTAAEQRPGGLRFGIGSVLFVAVLGRPGFNYLKQRYSRLLRKYGPPETVGRTRYRIGLAMFTLPILLGWLGPYLAHHIPGFDSDNIVLNLGGDIMFIASFFVLGGEFWDKVRALFIHDATAVMRSDSPPQSKPA